MGRLRSLKIGVSGIRGIVGDSLTPQLVTTFAQAFGSFVGRGTIFVGRDSRTSGVMVEKAVVAGLLAVGCQPVRVGICPVPSIQYRTKHSNAVGAIAITASHNPVEWNALKFINGAGLLLNAGQAEDLIDIYHQSDFSFVESDSFMPVHDEKEAYLSHLERLLSYLDVKTISSSKLKVAYDCCNGAGSVLTPIMLEKLGCIGYGINTVPNGLFPHNPEPLPENLTELCEKVRETGADIGFAQDADADRLAIINEKGEPIGEDYTLAFAVKHILSKKKGAVVTNISASKVIEDIAHEYSCPVIYTRIGEINVVEGVISHKAAIGGEGNGGVILPEIHTCRDSFIAMGIVLEMLSGTGRSVSNIKDSLPCYHIAKGRISCSTGNAHVVIRGLLKEYEGSDVITLDGIKINYPDSWLHIRPSNTEPILRLTSEAMSESKAKELIEKGIVMVKKHLDSNKRNR